MSSRRPSPPAWKQRSTRLNTRIDPLSDCRRTGASTQSGNDLQRGDAGKKAISDSPGDDEARESRDLQSREVVTATWAPLTGHRLATVIYPADVRSYGTTQPMRIARSVLVYVFEVVQFLRLDSPGRRIGIWGKHERNAVPPAPTDLRCQKFRVDLVLVALQEALKSNYILLHHLVICRRCPERAAVSAGATRRSVKSTKSQ